MQSKKSHVKLRYENRVSTHNIEIVYEATLSSTAEIRHVNLLVVLVLKINFESLLEEIIDIVIHVPCDIQRILLHSSGETLGEQVGISQQPLMNCIIAIGRFIRAIVRNAVPASTESAHLSSGILLIDVEPANHSNKQYQ